MAKSFLLVMSIFLVTAVSAQPGIQTPVKSKKEQRIEKEEETCRNNFELLSKMEFVIEQSPSYYFGVKNDSVFYQLVSRYRGGIIAFQGRISYHKLIINEKSCFYSLIVWFTDNFNAKNCITINIPLYGNASAEGNTDQVRGRFTSWEFADILLGIPTR